MTPDTQAIHDVLDAWARATREGRHDDILANHAPDAVIFDVLPPLRHDSAAAYRASWGDWQPDVQGDFRFALDDLQITAGSEVAFAFGLLHCGGTLPDGKTFSDTVRITVGLRQQAGRWCITHQHVSKPAA